MFTESFKKDWLPLLVDQLPYEEKEVLLSLYWEQASLRVVAARLGWRFSTGGWDAPRVERTRDRALARIEGMVPELSFLLDEHGFTPLGALSDE